MMRRVLLFGLLSLVGFQPHPFARAADAKSARQKGWGYLRSGPVEVHPKPSAGKRVLYRLGRGALVPLYEVQTKGTVNWARVRAMDLATLSPLNGWTDASRFETLPLGQFPKDGDLRKQLGGRYLDDFTAAHTEMARFLVRRGAQEPALVCFLGSRDLPYARLQIFHRSGEGFTLGPFLEFPASEMQSGITTLEVRDLLGDGNECLITHEPFSLGPENRGVKLVIRRIEGVTLKTLWQAPLEIRNLASFPPKLEILRPPERNIGAPGTVTTGVVDFRVRGNLSEPVWKGKIELYAFGREQPIETMTLEKVCSWDDTKFAPLY